MCAHVCVHVCVCVGDDVTAKCDYVFWCGDLNYRVDLDRKTADDLIARRNYVVSPP